METESQTTSFESAKLLVAIGKPAILPLTTYLSGDAKVLAAWALGEICEKTGDNSFMAHIISQLKEEASMHSVDHEACAKFVAVLVLEKAGTPQLYSISDLLDIAVSNSVSFDVVLYARDAIAQIGGSAAGRLVSEMVKPSATKKPQLAAEMAVNLGAASLPALAEIMEEGIRCKRIIAAEALRKINDSSAVSSQLALLRSALSEDKAPEVRAIAAEALGEKMDIPAYAELVPDAVPALTLRLMDSNYKVRASAAKALGKIKDCRAVFPLIDSLSDEDDDVRHNSTEALGRIGAPSAVPALIQVLLTSPAHQKDVAAKAIVSIGLPAIFNLVGALKSTDSVNWAMQMRLLSVIGDIGDKESASTLAGLLIGKTGEEELDSVISGFLTSKMPALRGEAAIVMGKLKHAPAVPALESMLKDEVLEVRCAAAEALGKISNPSATAAILESFRGCLEGDSDLEHSEFYKQLCGALDNLDPASLDDLRSLHKAIGLMKRSPQEGRDWEEKISEFVFKYQSWASHLRQAAMNSHEGMQEPPRSLRAPPKRFRNNAAPTQKKMVIGGGKP
jgi:HEAT repeat protein